MEGSFLVRVVKKILPIVEDQDIAIIRKCVGFALPFAVDFPIRRFYLVQLRIPDSSRRLFHEFVEWRQIAVPGKITNIRRVKNHHVVVARTRHEAGLELVIQTGKSGANLLNSYTRFSKIVGVLVQGLHVLTCIANDSNRNVVKRR